MELPKRVTQDEAATLAFEFLDAEFPEAPGTVDAYLCFVEDQAFVKQVPAWMPSWNEGVRAGLKDAFEFWCLWSSMMSEESYTRYVYTWTK